VPRNDRLRAVPPRRVELALALALALVSCSSPAPTVDGPPPSRTPRRQPAPRLPPRRRGEAGRRAARRRLLRGDRRRLLRLLPALLPRRDQRRRRVPRGVPRGCNARYEPQYARSYRPACSSSRRGVQACVAHLAAVKCEQQLKDLDGPCADMWIGRQAAGKPCGFDVQSLVCDAASECTLSLTLCGTCRKVVPAGASCSGGDLSCGAGATCLGANVPLAPSSARPAPRTSRASSARAA